MFELHLASFSDTVPPLSLCISKFGFQLHSNLAEYCQTWAIWTLRDPNTVFSLLPETLFVT